jgi:hypothetical protein
MNPPGSMGASSIFLASFKEGYCHSLSWKREDGDGVMST